MRHSETHPSPTYPFRTANRCCSSWKSNNKLVTSGAQPHSLSSSIYINGVLQKVLVAYLFLQNLCAAYDLFLTYTKFWDFGLGASLMQWFVFYVCLQTTKCIPQFIVHLMNIPAHRFPPPVFQAWVSSNKYNLLITIALSILIKF